MGHEVGSAKQVFGLIRGYTPWMKKVISVTAFSDSQTATYRLQVINHYQQFGLRSTVSAFPVKRSTVFSWQKALKDSGGTLASLIPHSSRPHACRTMHTHPLVLAEICRLRKRHYRLGKHKLHPLIKRYAATMNLTSPAESTIGKIIRRNHLFYGHPTFGFHDPGRKKPERKRKLRVTKAPKPKDGGIVEVDTIETRIDGLQRYTVTAIDVCLKVTYAQTFKTKHAKNARHVLQVLAAVLPTPITIVQTDNGSEFEAEFDAYCQHTHIRHQWTYPRSPKINGVIERFNRSIQEEWLNMYQDEMIDPTLINQRIREYLHFYHHDRIHESLSNQTPASVVGYSINYPQSPEGV